MHVARKFRSRAKWGLALMTVTALGATALGPPVNAAVGGNRVINVSPSDSIVLIEGLSDTTEYTVTLERGGVTIGTATGTPADFGIAGALELNHAAAPTFCWSGVTPEIIPGDVVRLTGGGVNDFATVEGLTVGDPVPVGNTSFTVSGTLDIDRTATPLDPNNLSVFVRLDVGGVDWRAESSTVDPANPLVFNGEAFTATFNSGRFGGVNGSPVNASVIDAAASPRVLASSYGVGTVPVEGVPKELTTVGPAA